MHQLCNVVQCVFGIWIVLVCFLSSSSGCDHKWIRMVYMLSCGKKKRNNPMYSIDSNSNEHNFTFPAVFGSTLKDALENYNQNESDLAKKRKSLDHPKFTLPFVSDGTPSIWMLEDLMDEENDLYRRQLGNLVEKCCSVPPVSSCSAKDFVGACK